MSRSKTVNVPDHSVTNYRELEMFSYSSLKLYDKNRIKYKKKFIDKEEEDDDDNDQIRIGNVVDAMLTDPDNAEKYYKVTSANKPSGQLLTFTDFLYKFTLEDTKDDIVSSTFEVRANKAYNALKEENGGKLRDDINKFLTRFSLESADYFKERLDSIGKTVVTIEEATLADSIVKKLKSHRNTKDIVNAEGLTKYRILFKYGDHDFKMEADKIIINHDEKVIYPYDYKITSFVEDFIFQRYIKEKYYIQSGLYRFGIESWKNSIKELQDYKVENMAFIVADQANVLDPLIYKTSEQHYEQSFLGFKVGNTIYKGINEIFNELLESIDKDIWASSVRNFNRNGVILIPSFSNLETND